MKQKVLVTAVVAAMAAPGASWAATGLDFGESVELSANGGANKTKISRLANGRLLAVFGDYTDPANYPVYDVKGQEERPARDLFVRTCEATSDCSVESNWSELTNISNTAAESSMDTDWDGNGTRTPFYGDSEKPNLYAAGDRIVVTWVDKFCPGGEQRSVSYLTLDNREIPFACTYAVTGLNGEEGITWGDPVQLSTGERDAKQDVNRGLGTGEWAVTWQEDPRGLQLGEADGPGDGASGANVSSGTDIWYSYALKEWLDQDDVTEGNQIWSTPVRITDNFNGQNASGNYNAIRDIDGVLLGPLEDGGSGSGEVVIESGVAGASRANLGVMKGTLDSAPQVIVAYEETKGSGGLDEGKFVRYHTFNWNTPPSWTSITDTIPEETAGCIISDPLLNARRVRFVMQREPGAESGMRLGIFWKEGEFTQGGPSDIMLRKGIVAGGNGFSPAEMVPAVDAGNCFESDFLLATQLDNAPALNMSSRTEEAEATTDADIATSTLSDDTYQKVEENAIAHRGLLRGDDLYVGYTYTPVLAELLYTNTKNYNFYMRHYDGVAGTWSAPDNLSNITDTSINVREPRLVGTPGNTPACSSNPEECQDQSRFYVAWGTQTNVSEWSLEEPSELDLYAALAEDKGATYTDVTRFAGEADDVEDFESQIQMTPAGNNLYVVWNENRDGGTHAMFRQSTTVEVADDGTDGGTDDGDSTASSSSSDGTLFGCSYKPGAPFDPTLFLLTALAIGGLTVRKIKARA
ncbi:choice-of-anchor O protein [Marinobacter pelagius]|uniref:Uncharacterized protein n=1 Tax=Marinobacter pelagius TaxID=379482 RepID=A0A1I4RCH6_9GAMM|nr:choice-of-anchor O protein [Marinobacter pelagius]SFM49736.1 hypothetical protein SAMN04487961_0479 [Marinobacter pelagius]